MIFFKYKSIIYQKHWMVGSVRTLFSKRFLGIKNYEMQRSTQLPFDSTKVAFETKAEKSAESMKYYLHVLKKEECEDKFSKIQTDLQLIHNHETQMKAFDYGTVTMRMFHYHNLPYQALKIYEDERIPLMFNTLKSKLVLLDLLFNNGMYADVLHIFKMDLEKQEKVNRGSAPILNCLAFAACYKLNTEAQLEYGLQLWNKLDKEKQLFQSGTFLGMLAINHGQPKTALEILESTKQSHFIPVFIRLIALADCGYFKEATKLIEEQKNDNPKFDIRASVVEKIGESLKKHPTTEEKRNFSKLLDTIPIRKWKDSIDEMLCFPIDPDRGLTPKYCSPNYMGPRYKKNR